MSAALEREYVPGFTRSDKPIFALPPKKQQLSTTPENELVSFGEEMYERARSYRDGRLGMAPRWKAHLAWFLNNGSSPISGEVSTTYVNLIFETIESMTSALTESDPTFLYQPNAKRDIPLTDLLNDVVPFVWDSQNGSAKYLQAMKGMSIYGTWYWGVEHDPRFAKTGSVVRIRNIPPWHVFPAPYATSIEDAPWVVVCIPRPVGEIYADYGVSVAPELIPNDYYPDPSKHLGRPRPFVGAEVIPPSTADPTIAATSPVRIIPISYMGPGERSGMAFQKILYIRDGTLAAEWGWHEGDGFVPDLKRTATLKYPKGRVISWANGQELFDQEMPYADGEFPLVAFRDITVPDFWYGLGEIHGLINLQLLHDDTMEMMKLMHLYMAVGRLIVDKSTGLRSTIMSNTPGEIWEVREGTSDRVKWLPGMVPPSEFYEHTSMLKNYMDLTSGRTDVTRGENPAGVRAARTVGLLQSAAQGRVRGRLREIESSLNRAGKLIASRVRQFWPSATTMRVTGKTPTSDFAEFRDHFLSADDREATFNLKVDAVANLSELKAQEFQKLLLLSAQGLVSPEYLIKAANLSHEAEILEELPALMAQHQMAQIQAAAGGGMGIQLGGGGGGAPAGAAMSNVGNMQRTVARSSKPPY